MLSRDGRKFSFDHEVGKGFQKFCFLAGGEHLKVTEANKMNSRGKTAPGSVLDGRRMSRMTSAGPTSDSARVVGTPAKHSGADVPA